MKLAEGLQPSRHPIRTQRPMPKQRRRKLLIPRVQSTSDRPKVTRNAQYSFFPPLFFAVHLCFSTTVAMRVIGGEEAQLKSRRRGPIDMNQRTWLHSQWCWFPSMLVWSWWKYRTQNHQRQATSHTQCARWLLPFPLLRRLPLLFRRLLLLLRRRHRGGRRRRGAVEEPP